MKTIYDEALLKLREIAEKLTRKQWIELTNNIELIRSNLQQAQKQEKLLELYEALVIVKDDMLSYCEVVDDDYYDSKELATSFEKQIKEIENGCI